MGKNKKSSSSENSWEIKYRKYKEKYKKVKKELKSAQETISQFKNGVLCPICVDMYALPFNLHCGHSFCYCCLLEWLESQCNGCAGGDDYQKEYKVDSSCPVCRMGITQMPIKNRDLQQIVETTLSNSSSDHNKNEKNKGDDYRKRLEYANNRYKRDTMDGKLNIWSNYVVDEGLFDREDGLRRCTKCLWEIVGNNCTNCGQRAVGIEYASDSASEEDEEDNEDEEEEDNYLSTDEEYEEVTLQDRRRKRRRALIESDCSEDSD